MPTERLVKLVPLLSLLQWYQAEYFGPDDGSSEAADVQSVINLVKYDLERATKCGA